MREERPQAHRERKRATNLHADGSTPPAKSRKDHAIARSGLIDNYLHIIDERNSPPLDRSRSPQSCVALRQDFDYYQVKARLGYGGEYRLWE